MLKTQQMVAYRLHTTMSKLQHNEGCNDEITGTSSNFPFYYLFEKKEKQIYINYKYKNLTEQKNIVQCYKQPLTAEKN